MPLARGFRPSWGRRRSPLSLIPWRRHSSLLGEAQCEKAACCGWAMMSLGWRSACCVGPCDPPTLLGRGLGVESPGDPACIGRLPVAVGRWFAEGWPGSPVLCRFPAGSGGDGGWELLPCPPRLGGKRLEGEQSRRSSAPTQGYLAGGGGDPRTANPASASLAALWRFCCCWAPSAGPCSVARLGPLHVSHRLSHSRAAGDGAGAACWSPGSCGRCSQPCMPLAADTCSACDNLRMPARMAYEPWPVGARAALGWPVCPYRQQYATPWPVARQRAHNGTPCTGHRPPVDPRPLLSPAPGTGACSAWCPPPRSACNGGHRARRGAW